jgi:hypothetical protein
MPLLALARRALPTTALMYLPSHAPPLQVAADFRARWRDLIDRLLGAS